MSGRIQVVVGKGAGGWGRRVARWLVEAGGGEGWVVGVGREKSWRGSLPEARAEELREADRLVLVCRRGREGSGWIEAEVEAFREVCPGGGRLLAVVVGGEVGGEGRGELLGALGQLARPGRAMVERVEVPSGMGGWQRAVVARARARLASWLTGAAEVDLLAGEWERAYVLARWRWRVAGWTVLGLTACVVGLAVLLLAARRELVQREGEVVEAREGEEAARDLALGLGEELGRLEEELGDERERKGQLAQELERVRRSQLVRAVDETWGRYRAGRADAGLALLALAEGIERLGATEEEGELERWRGRMAVLLGERPEWQRIRLMGGPYELGAVRGEGPVVERNGLLVRVEGNGRSLLAWDWRAAVPVALAMDLGRRAEGLWVGADGSWALVEREDGVVQLWGLEGSGKRGEWAGARHGGTSADGGVVRLDLSGGGGQLLVEAASGVEIEGGGGAVAGLPLVREVEGGQLEVWDFAGRERLAGPLTRGLGTEIEARLMDGGLRLLVVERPGEAEEGELVGRGRGGGAGGERAGLVVRLWEVGGRGGLLGAWDDVGLVAADEEEGRLAFFNGADELRLHHLSNGRELARMEWSAGRDGSGVRDATLAFGGRGRYLLWGERAGSGVQPARALVLAGLEQEAGRSEDGVVKARELAVPEHRPGRDEAGQERWGWSISESGGLLVAAGAPDVIQVWSLREGQTISPPGFPALLAPGEVAAIDLDERGMRLGAVTVDGVWAVWDVATGRQVGAGDLGREMAGRAAGGLELLGGGELLRVRVAMDGDEGVGEAIVLDAIGGLASRELVVGQEEVELVERPMGSGDVGATVGLGLDHGEGRVVLMRDGGRVQVIDGETGVAVQDVAGGAVGQHIVLAAGGGWVASVRPGVEPERELDGEGEEGEEGEVGEAEGENGGGNGEVVRVASSVLMLRTGGRLSDAKIFNPRGPVGGVGLSAGGGILAVGLVDGGGIDVWKVADRELVASGLDTGWERVERVAVSACENWLAAVGGGAVGGSPGGLAVWRLAGGGERVWLERGVVEGESLRGFWVMGGGEVVLAYGDRVEVWRDADEGAKRAIAVDEGRRLEVVPGREASVIELRELSADVSGSGSGAGAGDGMGGEAGWEMVLWGWDGEAMVVSGDAIWVGAAPEVWALSPDGQHLAVGTVEGGVGIWETGCGLALVEHGGWGEGLIEVGLWDGGKSLVAALGDGRVIRWRMPEFVGDPGLWLLADWARLATGQALREGIEEGVVVGRKLWPREVEEIWMRMREGEGEGS
jgi:hypothetical protein